MYPLMESCVARQLFFFLFSLTCSSRLDVDPGQKPVAHPTPNPSGNPNLPLVDKKPRMNLFLLIGGVPYRICTGGQIPHPSIKPYPLKANRGRRKMEMLPGPCFLCVSHSCLYEYHLLLTSKCTTPLAYPIPGLCHYRIRTSDQPSHPPVLECLVMCPSIVFIIPVPGCGGCGCGCHAMRCHACQGRVSYYRTLYALIATHTIRSEA